MTRLHKSFSTEQQYRTDSNKQALYIINCLPSLLLHCWLHSLPYCRQGCGQPSHSPCQTRARLVSMELGGHQYVIAGRVVCNPNVWTHDLQNFLRAFFTILVSSWLWPATFPTQNL